VMGVPHPSGRAAMKMLEREGFIFECYIDIFDGGPTMCVATDQVRTIRESISYVFAGSSDDVGTDPHILATGELDSFVSCYGHLKALPDGTALLHPKTAQLLGIEPGQTFLAMGR
jgi:arginine N-succinyltransferase